MCVVDGVYREVTTLDAGAVTHVANFIIAVGIPGGINCINFIRYFIDFVFKTDVIKQKELRFWAHVGDVANPGRDKVGFGPLCTTTRVTRIAFTSVGLNHGAMNADGFFSIERVNIGCFNVRHQFHVGFFDGFPTCDGRAVKHETFFEEVLIDLVGAYGYVLQFSARICEANVHIFDAFIGDLG